MSLLHVRQIETHLRDNYLAENWKSNLDDDSNMSRLLARYAVDVALGERAQDSSVLVEITDGGGDRGIDAVAVDPVTDQVVVIQSKWRKSGTGSIDLSSVLKFTNGIRSLLDFDSPEVANTSGQMKKAVRRSMEKFGSHLKIVLVTTAVNDLADEVKKPLDDLLGVLNDAGEDKPLASLGVLLQADIFDSLAQSPRESITLTVQLLDWGRTLEPALAYYGRVNGAQIAKWYLDHEKCIFFGEH